MIRLIEIRNFKSIVKAKIELGRINTFIGENGAGKSNILEAIALAGAAQAGKLDNEFLTSRGIRVSRPEMMRSAFDPAMVSKPIAISIKSDDQSDVEFEITNDNKPYSSWKSKINSSSNKNLNFTDLPNFLKNLMEGLEEQEKEKLNNSIASQMADQILELRGISESESKSRLKDFTFSLKFEIDDSHSVSKKNTDRSIEDFIVFSPENSSLRLYDREGQIEPLGVNGEGLLKLIHFLSREEKSEAIPYIKDSLQLFGWFKDFRTPLLKMQRRNLKIFDKYIDRNSGSFDLRSANEGFLFVLFYLILFCSELTPQFFAIDNIDASLNPKLCRELMKKIVLAADKNNKQAILTTHNPAMLDGIDLNDPEQKLFVISRTMHGETRIRQFVGKPSVGAKVRLSEMFMNGMLGGLPKGF